MTKHILQIGINGLIKENKNQYLAVKMLREREKVIQKGEKLKYLTIRLSWK